MSYELRLIQHSDPKIGTYFGVHDVYRDEYGCINGWSEYPINLSGDSLEEIGALLILANEAMLKPVLKIVDNGGGCVLVESVL
ncbi:hypothetical protein [Photobacterium damselae]|uniref:hypothetical protein n=1 Tax=Photobacterium damselae TaxID=38293 RepID=UPI001F4667BF|nr:hypothetical protein [Photobacterium damselae]UKA04472.1 hypothetical protein IHC89_22885 [Photobacterium damselae subsp. damselae]